MRALCIILVLACLHGGAANARAAGAKPHIVFTLTGARAALPRAVSRLRPRCLTGLQTPGGWVN